ncbi:MAG: tetratricopeptide repeat protein [Candidatus Omnitrophota bacterium]|jgi:tetratricopeptide (TPR) repeat protein
MDRKITIIAVILITILGFAVYANSISGKFVLDDKIFIVNNIYIKHWAGLPKLFTEDVGAGSGEKFGFFRPIQMVSYAVDYSVWKLNEKGYHITNILLQVLVALSIYWLITILFGDRYLSLLTAALFIIHPIHTEVVAYIAGRVDSLPLLFTLLCFILYIKQLDRGGIVLYMLMVSAYILAVLSKESALALPALLLLYHYTFRKKINFKLFISIMGIASVYFVFRVMILESLSKETAIFAELFQRLPGSFHAFARYIQLLLLPLGLHHDYGKKFFSITDPVALLGVLMFIFSVIYAFRIRNKNKLVFFSITWFLLALLPVANIYPLHSYMAERWVYMSSIGFFLIIAHFLLSLLRTRNYRYLSIALIGGLVIFYSALTINQNRHWKDAITLYKRTLSLVPGSLKARNNLANNYCAMGRYEEAAVLLKEAIEIDPTYGEAHVNLGNIYGILREYDKAIAQYKKALEIDPYDERAWFNLGNVYSFTGRLEDAEIAYENAIRIDPNYVKPYRNLGITYSRLGKKEEAVDALKKAIELNPYDPKAYNSLGIVYVSMGRYEEAITVYKKALELNPDFSVAYNNLAVAYYHDGQYARAVEACDRALELGARVNPEFLRRLKQYE